MKKIINTALIALTVAIALHGTANAKILRKRTIPVTTSTKDLFTDTKNLKASTTPEELKQNIQKVATDSKKDPYIRLKNEEMVLLDEIKNKEAEISGLEGYSGMFFLDSDELMEARNERADLYKELYEVQAKLDKTRKKQPVIETKIKDWAFYTLIATVGLAVADQVITGGEGRKALMGGVSTVGGKIGSAAKTTWGYAPSASGTWEATKTAFGYGTSAAGLGLALFNMKDLAKRLESELSEEQSNPNPDLQRIDELQQQLDEQNKKIAELEARIK